MDRGDDPPPSAAAAHRFIISANAEVPSRENPCTNLAIPSRAGTAFALALAALCLATAARAADDYQLGPDSQRHDGVPEGTVTKHHWKSKIFAGTERDYWVYVPAQYDGQIAGLRDGVSGRPALRRPEAATSACRSCSTT